MPSAHKGDFTDPQMKSIFFSP